VYLVWLSIREASPTVTTKSSILTLVATVDDGSIDRLIIDCRLVHIDRGRRRGKSSIRHDAACCCLGSWVDWRRTWMSGCSVSSHNTTGS